MVYLVRPVEFARHPQLEPPVTQADHPAGCIPVLLCNHVLQGEYRDIIVGKLLRKGLDPDLPFNPAGYFSLKHTRDRFDIILEVIGNILEADNAAGA